MWPFKKKICFRDTDVVSEWLESGDLNSLPDDEQRVFDTWKYLLENAVEYYVADDEISCRLSSNNGASTRVSCIGDNMDNLNFGVEISNGKCALTVVLPKAIKKHLLQEMVNKARELERKNWPLPTKFKSSKKKAK